MVASKNFKKYFEEIEALKNYDRVKKERDELAKEKPRLKGRISELEGNVEKQFTKINDLNSRLEGETKGREDVAKKLKSESKRADDLEKKLKSTSEELDHLKFYKIEFIDGKRTFKEAKEALIEARNNEIEKRSNEKFQKLKSDYDVKMPELVYKRLVQILEKPLWPAEITDAIIDKAKTVADGILRNSDGWPSWFKEYYRKEVSTRLTELLDDEFNRRVDEKSQKIAAEKLEILKTRAWPTWFSQTVKPEIDKNLFRALKGVWTGWTCNKCGAKLEFTLTEHNIGELLRNGGIEFPCPNANCIDTSLMGWRKSRHRIKIPLASLIARITEKIEIAQVPTEKATSMAEA